jgi:hypothetical protein
MESWECIRTAHRKSIHMASPSWLSGLIATAHFCTADALAKRRSECRGVGVPAGEPESTGYAGVMVVPAKLPPGPTIPPLPAVRQRMRFVQKSALPYRPTKALASGTAMNLRDGNPA